MTRGCRVGERSWPWRELTEADLADARRIARWWAVNHPRPWLVAQDAEGICCEAVARAAATFDAARGPWNKRLAYAARHALLDAVRYAYTRDADASLDDVVGEEDDVHTSLTLGDTLPAPEPSLPHEDVFTLRAALASVGPRDRLILRLIYEDGFSLTEVGGVVGLSKRGVKYAADRALGLLRGAM